MPGRPARCADLPWESALRRDRRCCAWPGGKRRSKLAARADAELGEHLPQVIRDGGAADEKLRGDLRVGGALAGQAGDQRFLRGKGIWRLDIVLPAVPPVPTQLTQLTFTIRPAPASVAVPFTPVALVT